MLARARAAGVDRVDHRRDDDRGLPRGARARRRATTGVYASLGIHPHDAADAGAGAPRASCASCSATTRAVAVGETGLDYFRDYAPREAQRRLFDAQLALAAELGLPVVDPHPRGRRRHARRARGLRGHRRPPLLLLARRCSSPRSSAAGTSRSPATSPTRRRPSCGRRPRLVPADRLLAETDSPYLAPQPVRGAAQRARERRPHARRRSPRPAARTPPSSARADRRERDARRSGCERRPPQEGARPALPRRREHPRRDRPARRARARRRRARDRPRPRRPHPLPRRARRPRPRGRDRPLARAEPRARSRARALHFGDALALDLAALDPPPGKLVANLPYNIATPLVVESLDRMPASRALVRDGAARGRRPLLRRPRRRRPTAPSRCSIQLAAERTGFHPVSREVFRPRPNVDSALVAFRRTAPGPGPAVKRLVEAAFAHRRKTLANSLALAGVATRERGGRRRSSRSAATPALGPRSSPPAEFVALAGRARDDRRRRAREDQPRPRRRPDRGPTACTRSRPSCSGSSSPTRSRSSRPAS